MGKFFAGGYWGCKTMYGTGFKTVRYAEPQVSRKDGILITTKAIARHPDGASKNVGVIVLKRIRCNLQVSPTVCEVYKSAQCIQCPMKASHWFSSEDGRSVVDKELEDFVNQCARKAWENPGIQYTLHELHLYAHS